MDDFDTQSHKEELSHEELEVLQAFHDLEFSTTDSETSFETRHGTALTNQSDTGQPGDFLSEDEMLALFATEADEDIASMRQVMKQIEYDNRLDSRVLHDLKRYAHKVAGTAAAIGCDSMPAIARHIETIIKLVEDGSLSFQTASIVLVYSIQALEATLQSIVSNGFESKNPLLELEEEYQKLNIDVHSTHTMQPSVPGTAGNRLTEWFSQQASEPDKHSVSLSVNTEHFNKLQQSAENLIELDIPIEQAQKQVETALNELQLAESRLHRLEPLLSSLTITTNVTPDTLIQEVGYPPSSLVARILQEASTRNAYVQPVKHVAPSQPFLPHEAALWDEMEIDRFSETNVLAHSLNEAFADVALATTHVQQALKHLKSIVAQQIRQANAVRNEAFLLRSLPFSFLAARLQAAIEMIAGAQNEHVHMEISGETVEIDQDVLERLAGPLLELVQMQLAEALFFQRRVESDADQRYQIGFHAHTTGNEITIEINFFQAVPPETITNLRNTVQHLYGSVSLNEKNKGIINLQLRLPRSQRMLQALLVRAGNQQVLVPVSQVQRIYFRQSRIRGGPAHDSSSEETSLTETHELYQLHTLLGLHTRTDAAEKKLQTALILELDHPGIAIEVDEVVKEVALVMKPLASYLCRPGITSTAIDANGNVLLVLNLPEMILQNEVYKQTGNAIIDRDTQSDHNPAQPRSGAVVCHKILIADDSIYIRQSIHMTLSHQGYVVIEALDGLQALDKLSQESPDLLLLDVEMPHLNGYDVLSIIRSHQEFAALKIIMLTSRSSEKHQRRASELGANAYLTKPCSQDDLLHTINSLFVDEDESAYEQVE